MRVWARLLTARIVRVDRVSRMREASWNVQDVAGREDLEGSTYTAHIYSAHAEHMQSTCSARAVHVQRTCSAHAVHTQCTCSGHIHCTYTVPIYIYSASI